MACAVRDVFVATCPEPFKPELTRAVLAFPTRTTFYLQCFLVAFNALMDPLVQYEESGKHAHIEHQAKPFYDVFMRRKTGIAALHQLIVMVVAMSCISFVLGFAPRSTLDFRSALVVIYILILAGTSVLFAAPTYEPAHFNANTKILNYAVAIQGFCVFAFIFSILATATHFGASYCCNSTAKVLFFGEFPALGVGRTVGWATASTCLVAFVIVVVCRMKRTNVPTVTEKSHLPTSTSDLSIGDQVFAAAVNRYSYTTGHSQDSNAPRARVVPFIAYALFWTVMVVHAELMIRRNNIVYAYKGDQEVQMSDPVDFAQTLQLPQVISFFVPFANAAETYRKILMVPSVLGINAK